MFWKKHKKKMYKKAVALLIETLFITSCFQKANNPSKTSKHFTPSRDAIRFTKNGKGYPAEKFYNL